MDQITHSKEHIRFLNEDELREYMWNFNNNIETLNKQIRIANSYDDIHQRNLNIGHGVNDFLFTCKQNNQPFIRVNQGFSDLRTHVQKYVGDLVRLTVMIPEFTPDFNHLILEYAKNVIERPETNPQIQFEADVKELCTKTHITVAPLTQTPKPNHEIKVMTASSKPNDEIRVISTPSTHAITQTNEEIIKLLYNMNCGISFIF